MRSLILAAAALGAAFTLQPATAQARDLPFCLITPNTTGYGDCSYYTYQQCLATASGQRGYCDRNYFLGSYAEPDDRVYSRKQRRGYY